MTWHILVVDDEPLNLEIIGEFLDDPDYQLSNAEHGETAWQQLLVADPPFDLILLDRMMPVMNGMELLRRVKADSRFAHLPVIMQTAASAPEEVREGIEAGAYYYLTKPYQPTALHAIVRAALDEISERRRATASTLTPGLELGDRTEFLFRSLDEAHYLAGALAALCPDPGPVAMGLTELLVNAIEHGNLEISYAEKKQLRQSDGWEDEVARRLRLPEFAERVAKVTIERAPDEVCFVVEDAGQGFDWQTYLEFDPQRAFDPNGRGIAMARQVSFAQLQYRGRGNIVAAVVAL
jgi:DNA-binding response OmpR family regulator